MPEGMTAATAVNIDARVGTRRWGLLRDSDPFTGVMTEKVLLNYAVSFEMAVRFPASPG